MSAIRKTLVLFALAATAVVACSLVFNRPIRLKPKKSPAIRSLAATHCSALKPDNVVLTPGADMATSISISWRTSTAISDGVVLFDGNGNGNFEEAAAALTVLTSEELRSDDIVHCHSATLTGLLPGTTYAYRVGSKTHDAWSETGVFSTAPASPESFSFVYIGDTQKNPKQVGKMLEAADSRHPETAFYMIGGDLVDVGDSRNAWDSFMASVGKVFFRKPVAPAMGNHDFGYLNRGPAIYNAYFAVPDRDREHPDTVRNYSFGYGKARFIIVNNLDFSTQTEWLEKELKEAGDRGDAFKIVMFHFPVYGPRVNRENAVAQNQWVPLFDKYGVDLVLAGHDHSYMRSKPLNDGKAVAVGERGTTYVVATGCEKFYPAERRDIAARQFTAKATYQLISLETKTGGNPRLFYRAYSPNGEVLDEFVVTKP